MKLIGKYIDKNGTVRKVVSKFYLITMKFIGLCEPTSRGRRGYVASLQYYSGSQIGVTGSTDYISHVVCRETKFVHQPYGEYECSDKSEHNFLYSIIVE